MRHHDRVTSRGQLLGDVMRQVGITQSELPRLSGIHQPSISQFLSGKIDMSDEQLDRLLSCMGYRQEVIRRPVPVELTRSERRSWQLDRSTLDEWRPAIRRNLQRLRGGVQGQPHERNVYRWGSLVGSGDLGGLRRVLTGLDRDSIEMREVSPVRWAALAGGAGRGPTTGSPRRRDLSSVSAAIDRQDRVI